MPYQSVVGHLQQEQQAGQHNGWFLCMAGGATQGQVCRRMRRLSCCRPLLWGAYLLSAQLGRARSTLRQVARSQADGRT